MKDQSKAEVEPQIKQSAQESKAKVTEENKRILEEVKVDNF